MAASPAGLENHLDCLLSHIKRSASKVMDEHAMQALSRPRSACFELDAPAEEPCASTEEIELNTESVSISDVADLLQPQYAIITGGKSRDGCPLITFPDNANFHLIDDAEFQRLMVYLTSVPSLQDVDMGFHIVVDRRKDRWNSVKTVLLKISSFFPALIHVVYVIRPTSFLQKALSEMSTVLFKENFKFRVIVLNSAEDLMEFVDPSQLTEGLGGSLPYSHIDWLEQRISLEQFSVMTHEVSCALDDFTKRINETEFPNDVESTQELLEYRGCEYSDLKEKILAAAKHGEHLLFSIRGSCMEARASYSAENRPSDMVGNVFAIERLLVQLEETEKTFDEFWQEHFTKMSHCLRLRRFERDFRELQVSFDNHLRTISEMTEIGETVGRVETLIKEANSFKKLCLADLERAEEVVASGQQLLDCKNSCPIECIEPKCLELNRVKELLADKLEKRIEGLVKLHDLMERVDKANKWCAKGIELLSSQHMEKCSTSITMAEEDLAEILEFYASAAEFKLNSPKDSRNVFQASITPETKALVTQVLQRIDDVSLMCDKRISYLKKIVMRPNRPVQTVLPEPALPICRSPVPVLTKANTVSEMDAYSEGRESSLEKEPENRIQRGHVLGELLGTEKAYVSEIGSIIRGYKEEFRNPEMHHLVPVSLADKVDVLFGNLDEIHQFHSEVFLKDLENCITSTDLVALCFVQRKEDFFRLYSYYCQNIGRSEQLRENLGESHMFFQACQQKLGHQLPLAAYLLKPVQRITKYQLLLKDLYRFSENCIYRKELQQALDCMLVVLKCVNDSMHQIAITDYPEDLCQQGELLLQGSFSVWSETKKDLRLRLKPVQRHIFLYQKAMLFCKNGSKTVHNKDTYVFKQQVKMSQIGLTESVRGDERKFEVWLKGRQEVHTIQASTLDQKQAWVNEIKRVLLNQLEELKGEKIKQYSAHRMMQTVSWDKLGGTPIPLAHARAHSYDSEASRPCTVTSEEDSSRYSSDCSNSDDDDQSADPNSAPTGRFVALADYCAVGSSEVSMREGDIVELMKVGCAGWWFVKVIGTSAEGWAPGSYLRRLSRMSSRSQDRLNDH